MAKVDPSPSRRHPVRAPTAAALLLLLLQLLLGARRAAATACFLGAYSYGGGCSPCPPGATIIAATGVCRPSSAFTAGPNDTAFYLSGTQAEGVLAFPGALNASSAGVFGAANGSLAFASGARYLNATPAAGGALLASLPTGDAAFTASAWYKCAAGGAMTMMSWGAPSASGASSPQAATLAAGAAYGNSRSMARAAGQMTAIASGIDFCGVAVDAIGNVIAANPKSVMKIFPSGTASTLAIGPSNDVAVDLEGNVAFVSPSSDKILLISPAGTTSTLVSSFTPGSLALDAAGNVIVADSGSNRIAKVSPAGTITTVAVGFAGPVAVDPAGNVLVADAHDNDIKKISPAGLVTILSSSGYNIPEGIAADAAGNVIVADTFNSAVRKISPGGAVSTIGSGFSYPTNIFIDAGGNIIIQDRGNSAIKKISPSGAVSTLISGLNIEGFTVDSAGNIIVADSQNSEIRSISPAGVSTTLASGNGVNGIYPTSVVIDAAGNIIFSDTEHKAVKILSSAGVLSKLVTGLNGPWGVAFDVAGNLFVTDSVNGAVKKVSKTGSVSTIASGFIFPRGVAVDAAGNVLVADTGYNVIRKVSPAGAVSTVASGFNGPSGIAVDSQGSVIVADTQNNAVKIISPSGTVRTVVWDKSMSPQDVAVDGAGNILVADFVGSAIRMIAASATQSICDSTWHHLAVTHGDGAASATKTYLDGALISSAPQTFAIPSDGSASLTVNYNGVTGISSGSVQEVRLYSRALSAAEVFALAQPPLVQANTVVAPPVPVPAATSYAFSCAAGAAGSPGFLSKSSADNSWAWAPSPPNCTQCSAGTAAQPGFAACALCSPGTYSLAGAAVCAPCPAGTYGSSAGLASAACSGVCTSAAACPAGTAYPPASAGVTPGETSSSLSGSSSAAAAAPTVVGPGDAVLRLSGTRADGLPTFFSQSGPAGGVSFGAGVFGVANSSLVLANGSYLNAPGSSAPAALPADGNVAWSASAWVKCAAPALWSAVLEWGATGDARGGTSPQTAALAVSAVGRDTLLTLAVLTHAGGGGTGGIAGGHADGAGTAASFAEPSGVAVYALAGTVFVADRLNNLIRKIEAAAGGTVTTFVGGGGAGGTAAGHADGTGVAATFNRPGAITVDKASGAVYICDTDNHLIRNVSASGIVTTLAGGGSVGGTASGRADGTGVAAKFYYPQGIAVNSNVFREVFVADTNNHVIRAVNSAAISRTIAGGGSYGGTASGYADGVGVGATFSYPHGLAIDAAGTVFVADMGNNLIRKISEGAVVTTLAGGGSAGGTAAGSADGTGVGATFNAPWDVAVDAAGSVFVADTGNHCVRKVTAGGVVTTLAGGGNSGGGWGHADGTGVLAAFWTPRGLAVDSSGFVFVADSINNLVRKGAAILAVPACDAKWHHVALAYSPTSSSSPSYGVISAYLDGALAASSSALVSLPAAASSTLRIGWSGNASVNSGSLFAGSLADLRLFNRSLAQGEAVELAQPAAASFAGAGLAATTSAAAGASSYLFACAAGYAGPSVTLLRSSADNSWSWASTAPSCTPCAAGTSSAVGAAACSPCSPGTYSLAGAAACSLCPAGTFGSSAGLASSACSGACAYCNAGSTAGPASSSSSSSSSAPLTCASSGARAAPASLSLLLWPAAHPANAQQVDLVVAPLAACQQLTSPSACAAAASVTAADGVTRYVIGTAAALHFEAAEALACSAR
jgi:sugar lactone lactonase YvrE